MKTRWRDSAPSNIALIKYMGKTDASGNRPTNSSLSYTLEHLRTHLELELLSDSGGEDRWEPLEGEQAEFKLEPLHLSDKGRDRFLRHLARIKAQFDFAGSFLVRSANDFPSDCGLASSASSFAALTKTAVRALTELSGKTELESSQIADLSRQGSGSSCRSFFSPWSIWTAEGAKSIELPYSDLIHQVVIVEDSQKLVSSSEAHLRVSSSLLFRGRPERAEDRLKELVEAMQTRNWKQTADISWAEFWDMHALFETAQVPFGYMTAASLEVIMRAREFWLENGDGPLVTMDAGANVHLLYRPESDNLAETLGAKFKKKFNVISSKERREQAASMIAIDAAIDSGADSGAGTETDYDRTPKS